MMAVEVDHIVTEEALGGLNDFELAVVAKKSTILALLELLAIHQDPFVRAALCENPNLTPDLIKRLKEDPSPHVRLKAENLIAPELTDAISDARSQKNGVLGEE